MSKRYTANQIKEIKQLEGVMVYNHVAHGKCGSSDAASYWQKDYNGEDVLDGFCYSCTSYIDPNEDHDFEPVDDVDAIEEINLENLKEVEKLPLRGWRQRKVSKPISEFYGVRTELTDDGEVLNRFYPCRNSGGVVTRYKARNCIKKGFWSVGKKHKKEQFFGQNLFPKGGNNLIIAGGEEDAMSAYQMLKTSKYSTPCISPTNGEGSLSKQIQDNFDYVTSFKTVIIMMDKDEAGVDAAKAAIRLLRPDQGRIWKPTYNDVNEYLVNGDQEGFKTAYFKAERVVPAGVVGSSDPKIWDAIINRAKSIKIPLPPFAKQLEDMLRGGPALGEITSLVAASSIGKTSILNAFTYDWIMNAPYKVGIISLESDLGELGENLLSIHMGTKLANLYDEEKLALLDDSVKEKFFTELAVKEDGSDRFTILDHQSSIMDDELKRKIEHLVKVEGCQIIILDPLTLALSGTSNDGMDEFCSWYLRFVKREQISAFNVLHVRKNQSGQKANSRGGEISEEDIKGSGAIFQTSMQVWLFMRDKNSDDPIVRNTTKVVQSKARRTGQTGTAGYWYYNNDTGCFEVGRNPEDMDVDEELELLDKLGANDNTDPAEFKY